MMKLSDLLKIKDFGNLLMMKKLSDLLKIKDFGNLLIAKAKHRCLGWRFYSYLGRES